MIEYELINPTSIAKTMNKRVYTDYYYRLMLIARSVFEWQNLPNGIDEKWIERYLFEDGCCAFFKDKKLGLMVTRCNGCGTFSPYDEPTLIKPYATNYTGDILENGTECILIRNNDAMIPTYPTIQLYAKKITDIDRTISVNIEAQKMPIIIKCSDKQRLTLKNVIAQRNDNEPVIYGDKTLETDAIEVLNTNAPIVFKDLELEKHMVWNECMSFLGINNANMDKRERLVDDEVQANNEQVEASFNIMLKAREKAADDINKLFGTNIRVVKRAYNGVLEDYETVSEASESEVAV